MVHTNYYSPPIKQKHGLVSVGTIQWRCAKIIAGGDLFFLFKLDNVIVGRYLSIQDNEFVDIVVSDINHFVNNNRNSKSVLVFPPVNNYRRFLIHKVCEESAKQLQTFSIGQGHGRRTVVCFKELFIREPDNPPAGYVNEESTMVVDRHVVARVDCSTPAKPVTAREGCVKKAKSLPTIGIYRPPAARKLAASQRDEEVAKSEQTAPTGACKSEKQRSTRRRPDIQVYVPRAKRALIGDVQYQNVDSGNKVLACFEGQASVSSQKHVQDSEMLSCQSRTEQWTTRPPEDADKLSCHEVSNKETGRSLQLQRRHLSSRKIFHSDEVSFPDEKLSNGSSGSCSMMDGQVHHGMLENLLPENTDCQRNGSLGSENSQECGDSISSVTSCLENKGEITQDEHLENGCETVEEPSKVGPVSDGSYCLVESCDQEMEEEKSDPNPDSSGGLQVSNKVAQQTELRNTMQGLDIKDDGVFDTKKKEGSDEDNCRKEENRRTRRILRRNFMSDVLIISDASVKMESSVIGSDSRDGSSRNEEKCPAEKSTTQSETVPREENLNETKSTTALPNLNPEECTWDMMFDDNGDCLDPNLMEELTRAVGSVAIEKPQSDYRSYQSKLEMFMSGSGDEFAHVVEIYNFPAEFKTEDLLSIFAAYKNGGFEIKWVDDTHALGVFSSSRVAAEVLSHEHPLVKTRPLSQATHESRAKARRVAEFLQPYRARPETCAALARRLVTGALGVRLRTSQEERDAERRLLREAREKKRLAARQREAAWEGTFSEHNKTV